MSSEEAEAPPPVQSEAEAPLDTAAPYVLSNSKLEQIMF